MDTWPDLQTHQQTDRQTKENAVCTAGCMRQKV